MNEHLTPHDVLLQAVREVQREAYIRGLEEGATRLDWLASIVPTSVSRQWLVAAAARQAAACRRKGEAA